ncbi:MAG: hypothetical protein QOG15_2650 [Solirubrobacteraceae bacterium]|jgi:hypothetical protein|nr:hypothetical protein [Solirubrobacteraceae bacterium]
MLKHAPKIASLVAAGALLAVPAIGQAAKSAKAKNCTTPHSVAFSVGGKLVSVTPDDPATPASEATVTLKLTSANRHAKKSGDIADQDPVKNGVQVKGAEFTVPAGDAFLLKLNGYQGTDTPSVGDKVKVKGKIALTKKQCAPAGTSTADRYGALDVRKVTIADRDPDA